MVVAVGAPQMPSHSEKQALRTQDKVILLNDNKLAVTTQHDFLCAVQRTKRSQVMEGVAIGNLRSSLKDGNRKRIDELESFRLWRVLSRTKTSCHILSSLDRSQVCGLYRMPPVAEQEGQGERCR